MRAIFDEAIEANLSAPESEFKPALGELDISVVVDGQGWAWTPSLVGVEPTTDPRYWWAVVELSPVYRPWVAP